MGRFLRSYHSLCHRSKGQISSVILAWSSISSWGGKIAILVVDEVVCGARSARFFQGFRLFEAPKSQNFAGLRALTEPWADSQLLRSQIFAHILKVTLGVLNAGPKVYSVTGLVSKSVFALASVHQRSSLRHGENLMVMQGLRSAGRGSSGRPRTGRRGSRDGRVLGRSRTGTAVGIPMCTL